MINNELYHYGIKRRSGRYPYGSGKKPHQHEDGKSKVHGCLGLIGSISAALLGGAVVSVGAEAIKDSMKRNDNKTIVSYASDNPRDHMSRTTDVTKDVLIKTKLKLKRKPTSLYDDLVLCNEDYDPYDPKWANNCTKSCISNYMRRIGFDVKANPMTNKDINGMTGYDVDRLLPGFIKNTRGITLKSDDPMKELSDEIFSSVDDDNAFGFIDISFNPLKMSNTKYYHYITWEKIDGKIVITDPQSASDERVKRMFSGMNGSDPNVLVDQNVLWTRIDDLNVNVNELNRYVSNR